jgi:hypothetical protein
VIPPRSLRQCEALRSPPPTAEQAAEKLRLRRFQATAQSLVCELREAWSIRCEQGGFLALASPDLVTSSPNMAMLPLLPPLLSAPLPPLRWAAAEVLAEVADAEELCNVDEEMALGLASALLTGLRQRWERAARVLPGGSANARSAVSTMIRLRQGKR